MARVYYPACRAILQVVLDDFGPDDDVIEEPLVIPVLARSATIVRNSYRQADSYELGFEAGDFPFDPRLIRAGAAEVYLYQADALGEVGTVSSRKDPLADLDPGAARAREVIDTLLLETGVAAKGHFTAWTKPQIAGLFDRSQLEMSEDGKWITLNGQDYTAHLASLQWKPNPDGSARRIPVGRRIDDLVAELLAEADPTGRLRVDVRGIEDEDLPIVGAGDVRGSARGIPVEQNTSYWDVIYKVVLRVGLIAYVDGLDVVLSRPKTITDRSAADIKRLAWGKNLEHLMLERELGKEQTPTIVVKSYDPVSRSTITVEYPPGQIQHERVKNTSPVKVRGTQLRAKTTEKHRAKPPSSKGKKTTTLRRRDEYQIVTVHGVTDRKALQRIAENRYHLIGKSERRCIAKTRDLRDMRESDMLNLSAGDAVTIDWDEFNRELLSSPDVPDETKVEHLVTRGYNRAVAQLVARRYAQLAGLDRPLRVREVTYTFDADEGIDIELELYDFIMVDGIRSGDGATRPSRAAAHRASLVNKDGRQIGLTDAQRTAVIRRHDR